MALLQKHLEIQSAEVSPCNFDIFHILLTDTLLHIKTFQLQIIFLLWCSDWNFICASKIGSVLTDVIKKRLQINDLHFLSSIKMNFIKLVTKFRKKKRSYFSGWDVTFKNDNFYIRSFDLCHYLIVWFRIKCEIFLRKAVCFMNLIAF